LVCKKGIKKKNNLLKKDLQHKSATQREPDSLASVGLIKILIQQIIIPVQNYFSLIRKTIMIFKATLYAAKPFFYLPV
jgi:hypothetical protein